MKAILISDHAKWCALMMNGIKTIEVRKGTALYKATQKLIDKYGYAEFYVYCTKDSSLCYDKEQELYFKGVHNLNKISLEKHWANEELYGEILYEMNCKHLEGKVAFKFRCYNVEEIKPNKDLSIMDSHSKELIRCADLSLFEGCEYLKWNIGYAIHISDLEIFDKPKELSEFRKVMSEYNHWLLCAECPRYWEDESGTPIEPRCELNWKHCDRDRLTKAPQSFMFIEVGE